MAFAVIGTAGHVDHGKTALVRALTGVDTDRLPEERRRGISIDLGFAHLTLPSGRGAAIVDVPGHERFIKNMVAGASGIDCCLLVVAADEGVMPQTREHLDIVGLLGVARGVVALTKADLVEPDWLELVRSEVAEALRGTFLADAPVVACSAVTGDGLDQLLAALDQVLGGESARTEAGSLRLPVDRVFSVAGFGTVVTGTLTSGRVAVEDRLELWPAGRAVRVRGLQVHGAAVSAAGAGQRAAVNLGGVERAEVRRGDVLASPGSLGAVTSLAVRLDLLPRAGKALRSGQRVHLHTGTAEVLARVNLLEADELPPGGSCFALLRTEEPVAAGRGDRYIIRSYSPVTTIGGGQVLEAGRRFRRFEPRGLGALQLREHGAIEDLVLAAAAERVPVSEAALVEAVGAPADQVAAAAAALADAERLVAIGGRAAWQEAGAYRDLAGRVGAALEAYHRRYPLRSGMPREELRQALWPGLDARASGALLSRLETDGAVAQSGERVARAGWQVQLPPRLTQARDALLDLYREAALAPPPVSEALAAARVSGEEAQELLFHLVEAGLLARVDESLFFDRAALDDAVASVRRHLAERGSATVAELRDLLGTTRKYAVPLAEYLDRIHVTRRVGDQRRLA